MQQDDDKPSAQEPTPVAADGGQPVGVHVHGPDLRRRRLVRGAAAGIVPAIVTLRSGGVAAMSACPGQIAVTATAQGGNNKGELALQTTGYRQSVAESVGDDCYLDVDKCDGPNVSGAYNPQGFVSEQGNSGKYYCRSFSSNATFEPEADQTVYIITTSSTVSLL